MIDCHAVTVSTHSCFVKLGTMATFELQAAPESTSASNSLPLQVDTDAPQTVSLTDRLGSSCSFRRKTYMREEKIRVLAFCNSCNLYKTCQHFKLNTKNMFRWLKDEKIGESKRNKVRVSMLSYSQRPLFIICHLPQVAMPILIPSS